MNLQVPNTVKKNQYLNRWRGGAWTLFLIGAFSVLNILMYAFGSDSYFLFTAYLPYSFGIWGVNYLTGWYDTPVDSGIGTFFLSISAVFIILYFVIWFFSRKKAGWLIAGLVLFLLDTLYMVYAMIASGDPAWFTMDCIIHALAIAEIAVGLHAALKYGKLPVDVPAPPQENPDRTEMDSPSNEENASAENSQEF